MTTAPLTPELLRQQLGRVLKKHDERGIVGVHAAGPWRGKDRIQVGDKDVRVVWCPSVLAVREQLAANDDATEALAILTDQLERELGKDVMSRFLSARLYRVDRWRLLEDVFQADRLDPRLVKEKWLAGELLACAPPGGFRPVPAGFLDEDTAWAAYLCRRFRFANGGTELADVLRWSVDPNRVAELAAAPEEIRDGVIRRIGKKTGAAGQAIGGLLQEGRGVDALPLGLAIGVVFADAPDGKSARREAGIRLEGLSGGMSVDMAAGRRWAETAEGLLASLGDDEHVEVSDLLRRGDALMVELRASDYAFLSSVLPSGLRQRIERFTRALRAALEIGFASTAVAEAEDACETLVVHRGFQGRSREVARQAVRLLRALGSEDGKPARSFVEAARTYADHGSYLDWLRDALHGAEGEPALASAYEALLTSAEAQRHALNERFGRYLVEWFSTGSGSPDLVPVESILDDVLAPVVSASRVLFLVVDGLSLPVFHRLQDDILGSGWVELAPATGPRRRHGLALLPSVTNVCRASLLSGALKTGGQAAEKKGFENHPALRSRSKGGAPPILFHKAELRSDAGGALAKDLHDEIAGQRRVVGVVVNAVDDYLQNSEQLRTDWGLDSIKPLAALLEAAAASERIVVLTADHGHVPERGLEKVAQGEGGDRYRRDDGSLGKGEVVVDGPRVMASGNRIVIPWSERIRYGMRKSGYHGGASPQELLVPISVLTAGSQPEGWVELAAHRPDWWFDRRPAVEPAEPATEPPLEVPKLAEEADQGSLFPRPEPVYRPKPPSWIDRLFESEIYKEQRSISGRTAPPEPTVRSFLLALEERGGVASRMALCQSLELPQQRLDGLASAVERLLNVEGYPTIKFDREGGQVRLNRTLLSEQFQLP